MPRTHETRFDELKRYVAFGVEDAAALTSFQPVAAPHFDRIAAVFYDRTRDHAAAHAVFRDEAQVDRLRRSLVRWMGRLCGGVYDENYYSETLTIGRVHVRIELPQRYMLTAMSLIRLELGRIAEREMPGGGVEVREALAKILDLDLAIMLESYRDDSIARLQRAERDEMVRLSRALARTEYRYLHAVEKAQVLIVGFRADGVIGLFNAEAERVTGRGRAEAIGRSFASFLITAEDRTQYDAFVSEALARGVNAAFVLDSVFVTPAGKERQMRWLVSYAPAEAEELVFFAIGRDVGDEKATSERSRRHEKLAAVGTLAAGLAHEIRNPLNGAQLHLTFLRRALQKGAVTPEMSEATEVVSDELRRLARLVTEFLEFARPHPLQRKPVALRHLCERAVQLITPGAQSAGVELIAEVPTRDVTFSADGHKLEQVLLNLLRNAVEALAQVPQGRVILRVRKQPHHVLLEVEDNGPGLPPEAPVFDAFFTTKPQGTGLGLSISHRIIADHGGEMTVESQPGLTVFRVRLPLDDPESPAEPGAPDAP
jgi:PAS domain S-box-containing protein